MKKIKNNKRRRPLRIICVVGARPNYMKVAPILREMSKYPGMFKQILVDTGQHYDNDMSRVFLKDLRLPEPDMSLSVGSASHAAQTARIMLAFEPVLKRERPDWVVVVGDVNSTLACALASSKLGIKTAHVEAGLRSRDRSMPEEINRILTDSVSDLLFTPSRDANENLRNEGIEEKRIILVGNVMIDTLVHFLKKARTSPILKRLNLRAKDYAFVTLHRPDNVDSPGDLKRIIGVFEKIARQIPIVLPLHPRTRKRMEQFGLYGRRKGLLFTKPLGYIDSLCLSFNARIVLTDSGGMQEETTFMGVPCLTLRNNTERPVTVNFGTNRVIGTDSEAILQETQKVLSAPERVNATVPELWDGRAAKRIVNVFRKHSELFNETKA